MKSRRKFLKDSATFASIATVPSFYNTSLGFESLDRKINKKQKNSGEKINGIQVGAVSFIDEGIENVLDILQELGNINTIFITVFTHGRGLAGRQIPGVKFPDHGSQESDEFTFHGGNYATPHAKYYKDTSIKVPHAPEHGDFDVLDAVIPLAKKRGMKIICSIEDQWRRDVPGIESALEINIAGEKMNSVCQINPNVRNFWKGITEDLCRSYDIDGILFFNERSGSLLNALGASHFQSIDASRTTCFCNYHAEAAKKANLDFGRVKEGYNKLKDFVVGCLNGVTFRDGNYVEFQRILLNYPEIIAWDKLFNRNKLDIVKDLYDTVKSVDNNLLFGFHIEHVNSFNPYFRAEIDYSKVSENTDFLKIVAYNNCGGPRYENFINNINSTIFREVAPNELMEFNNYLLGYSNEASYYDVAKTGLSSDYVYKETKRAIEGVGGKSLILPGIDIGIPVRPGSRIASPDDTFKATAAAYKAGSDGCILSRKYSEMMLGNLKAAGDAIRKYT